MIKSMLTERPCTIASDHARVRSGGLNSMLRFGISSVFSMSVGGRLDWCGLLRLGGGYLAHGALVYNRSNL
jgi:hypothetical protein